MWRCRVGIENHHQIVDIIEGQLKDSLRYRCLLFQSNDISTFPEICKSGSEGIKKLGKNFIQIDTDKMIDDIGALSCREVIKIIEKDSLNNVLIISGPLHFLDYWSDQQCSTFWGHFASLENSAGIIIVDIIRKVGIEGIFTVIGNIPGTGVRYLKSRRAVLEAHTI